MEGSSHRASSILRYYTTENLLRQHTIHIDQTAVGSTSGTTTFYYVSEAAKTFLPSLPDWYDQLGSFDRQHIIKHLDGKLEPFIVTAQVNVEPLSSILRRHHVSDVTLLHIDTEGHDLEVLKSLGLPDICPSWIMIEHRHLSDVDRTEMISVLDTAGYDVSDTGSDFFAMHRNANHGLHRSGRVGRMFNGALIARA
jgi:FkbM family methyltransferase